MGHYHESLSTSISCIKWIFLFLDLDHPLTLQSLEMQGHLLLHLKAPIFFPFQTRSKTVRQCFQGFSGPHENITLLSTKDCLETTEVINCTHNLEILWKSLFSQYVVTQSVCLLRFASPLPKDLLISLGQFRQLHLAVRRNYDQKPPMPHLHTYTLENLFQIQHTAYQNGLE